VIDAFVEKLLMLELGFERAEAADTGRPGYDPRDLLKLYLYGYLNQIRSSRAYSVCTGLRSNPW
jgi:transposase